MKTELSDKLVGLANQLSYASTSKQAAKVRSKCDREEWDLILFEAKIIYAQRNVLSKMRGRVAA